MKKHTLKAQRRDIVGRKVKSLRNKGLVPATVYGKKVKSETITIALPDFIKTHQDAGETGLIELSIGDDVRPVLIHSLQRDPVTDTLLHVEFHQVDLKEKVHARVPVVFVGEADAVANKVGVLLTLIDEIEVEALPTNLPDRIEVNVSKLANVNDEIKVQALSMPVGVELLTDPNVSVVRVSALVSKEAEKEVAEAAAAQAAAPAEGETPAQTPEPAQDTTTT